MKVLKLWLLMFCIFTLGKGYGEIINLSLYWNPATCNEKCVELLKKNFSNVAGINEIFIDPAGGRADLFWKPTAPLDYNSVNIARKLVGVAIREVRVKVRGIIGIDNNQYTLTSLGDNTFFKLLAPVDVSPTLYVSKYHQFSTTFLPETNAELAEATKNNSVMIVEGQLYFPYRGPPLQLIAQFINVEKIEVNEDKK